MAQENEDFTTQLPESSPPPPPVDDITGDEAPTPTIRDHIDKAVAESKEEPQEKKARAPKKAAREDAKEVREQWRAGEKPEKRDSQALGTEQTTASPKAWNKEAQAEWNNLPPTVQAAVAKRESDIANGVAQLRQRYSDIDEAIKPHFEAIRQNGFTPGQAVGQLFGWFQALANDPVNAFPALAQSFGWDLNRLVSATQQQLEQQTAQQQELEQIPPYIRQALEQNYALSQRLTQHEQVLQQQNVARTHEVINNWAKDKDYFDTVREMMGQAIASGMVPLKDGRVDLDGAYAMACRAHPAIWQRLTAAQQAANTNAINQATQRQRNVDQQKANKARSAGVSISSSAPGLSNGVGRTQPQKKGMSVKESILAARDELMD